MNSAVFSRQAEAVSWKSEECSKMLRSCRMLRSLILCSASSLMISALKLSMSYWVSFRKGSNYTFLSL